MICERVVFSGHAVSRMFERGIRTDEVLEVIAGGEAISEYPDDTPYPSRLLLGVVAGRPVHVLVARDEEGERCIVVTVYEPTTDQWDPAFRTRRKQ